MTKKIRCTCKNEYQDKKYGEGIRIHNSLLDYQKDGYRCTVCSKINK